jgi:transposase
MAEIAPVGRIYSRVHEEKSIKKEQVIDYLNRLLRRIPGCFVILWDRASSHNARDVARFIDEHKNRISAYRIPPYSPDFNPVEWLFAEIK